MINFQDNIDNAELEILFGDKHLISTVREQLGDNPSYSMSKVIATAFINILSNNFMLDSSLDGDKFLKNVTAYLYNYNHIDVNLVYTIGEKAEALSLLLDILLECNSLPRYTNLVSWHYKYTCAVRDVLVYLEGYNLTGDLPTLIKVIPMMNSVLVRELGSLQPQVLAHILVQLIPNKVEKFRYVGRELRDSISVNNTLLAREGSVITHDLEAILTVLGIEDFPVKDYSSEAQYLMQVKSLRPIQIRVLKTLSYKNKIEVVRQRINFLLENEYVSPLVRQLKSYSEYEWQHAYNVSIMSALTAIELNLNGQDLDRLIVGAILHDIGKIEIPDEVLMAKRDLTEEERNLVKSHPTIGVALLNKFPIPIQDIARMHHENRDGSGYPLGRTSIPLLPSIVHVVDVYDAMCRQRDYKKPYDRTYVRNFIEADTRLFDQKVKDAFLLSTKLFLPGEALFISGIPCIMSDYSNGHYSFYSEGVGKCLLLTDDDVKTQLSWQNSMLN